MVAEVPQRISSSSLVQKLMAEGLIGMSKASRLLGSFRKDRPCHPSTVTRWCTAGVVLDDGTKLKLECVRVANRLCTSEAAIVRFLEQQQQPDGEHPADVPRSPRSFTDAATRAGDELERLGA